MNSTYPQFLHLANRARLDTGGVKRERHDREERGESGRNVRQRRAPRATMCAVATPKGGDTKTTSTSNIGVAWAKNNPAQRVLIIASDPCAGSAGGLATVGRQLFLGDSPPAHGLDELVRYLLDALENRPRRQFLDHLFVSRTKVENLDVMVAGRDLGSVKERMGHLRYGQNRLLKNSEHFQNLVNKYDAVFVDTEGVSADDSVLLRNVLFCCDKILVPMVPSTEESFSRVKELDNTLRQFRAELCNVEFATSLFFARVCNGGVGTAAQKELMNKVTRWARQSDIRVLNNTIPDDELVRASATVKFRPVVQWRPGSSPAAKQYLEVANVLARLWRL
ncbi:hypothetical protein CYMTET_19289 [Cymbomonas tetramitiformis]|uniref:AAA domain-containing protein n=1 Tax=Cymbomonas tetramitiformis TaxID=36881 RepID=A0AAE0G6C9_9CHLO|nr:hypothetical protein CYMTET_19289 [Cymbomonas tetramitiformis]